MPDPAKLLELAARCEKATGPEYDLDCAIWDVIYPGERAQRFEKLTDKGQPYHSRLGPADLDGYVKPFRAFTASLDAAVSLVGDAHWKVEDHPTIGISAVVDIEQGFAATPALALTAASLRALAAKEG